MSIDDSKGESQKEYAQRRAGGERPIHVPSYVEYILDP
jgi:hypothetical protein